MMTNYAGMPGHIDKNGRKPMRSDEFDQPRHTPWGTAYIGDCESGEGIATRAWEVSAQDCEAMRGV